MVWWPQERTCPETRAAGAQLLSAVARAGGAALWRDAAWYWEEALRVCAGGLGDPEQVCVRVLGGWGWRDAAWYWEEALRVCAGGLGDPEQVCVRVLGGWGWRDAAWYWEEALRVCAGGLGDPEQVCGVGHCHVC